MIEAKNLSKHFKVKGKPDKVAVADVSFTARDGQVTGLLGPNGAGKTTTLRMLSTLIEPTGGAGRVDGKDIRADAMAVKAAIGVLSDARGLYTRLTARENIRYYGELRGITGATLEARIEKLAALIDMTELLDRRTDGFSQGERMKVAIARALIHEPKNVILDEPTNGLDVMTTRSLRELIRKLREEGKCVVFSSHIMQEVSALCDDIVIVSQGRVVAQGDAQHLLEISGKASLEEAFVHLSGETDHAPTSPTSPTSPASTLSPTANQGMMQ
ncbi:MAG: ATP-binding cassette domain-containing protein [Betaproteobacteria bacterium]|nr:ATP-binding cassette domain-containing protein [Betaproteobacteria bacterium]